MSETVLTIVWKVTAFAIGLCGLAFAIICGLSLWNGYRNGAECLVCGQNVRRGNEQYDCPGHGSFEGDEYVNGEWIDPNWSRGFNKKPTDESDPEFRFHDRVGETRS